MIRNAQAACLGCIFFSRIFEKVWKELATFIFIFFDRGSCVF